MKLNRAVIEELLSGKFSLDSPITRGAAGAAYLSYDSMRIRPGLKGRPTVVEFHWQGKPVAYLEIEADFARGDEITITGIQGRQGITCG
jgi:hypothetical protein